MKAITLYIILISALMMPSLLSAQCITDQTVTATPSTVSCSGNVTVSLGGSQTGASYWLRNDANNSVVAGPISGTGSPISFAPFSIPATTTYNVYAEKSSASTSLDFDGSNDKVVVPGAGSLLQGDNTWTIEFWINAGTLNKYPVALAGNRYFLFHSAGTIVFYTGNGIIQCANYSYPADNQPHHFAVASYGNNNARIYIDGVAKVMTSNSHTGFNGTNGLDLTFGSAAAFTAQKLDEFRLWNYGRSAAEIAANRSNCLTGTEPGLLLYYPMNEGAGNSVLANLGSAGPAYSGTMINMDPATDWVAGMGCGTTTTCTFQMTQKATVTLAPDVTGPVVTSNNLTAQLGTNGTVTISPVQVATVTDACSGVASVMISPTVLNCSNLGVANITVTATDNALPVGNTTVTVVQVNVVDPIAPVVVCKNDTLFLGTGGTASNTVNDMISSVSDNCSVASLTASQTLFTAANIGNNSVTVTATDSWGNSSSCLANVYVIEPAPVAVCKNATLYLNGSGQAILTPSAVDGGSYTLSGTITSMTVSQSAFSCANLGENLVTLVVTNSYNLSSSCQATVTVVDNTAPVITPASTPITLWPPNHNYQTVNVTDFITALSDNCSSLNAGSDVVITRVTSDEPEDAPGNGDGNTIDDILVASDCHSVQLRMERQGNGNGRVYTIYVQVADGSGNTATTSFEVWVPKNANSNAVNSGVAYQELSNCSGPGPNSPSTVSNIQEVDLTSYPNPVISKATVKFSLSESSYTKVTVYNSVGLRVISLFDGMAEAGQTYEMTLDGSSLQSGFYFIRLQNDNGVTETRKIILAK